MYYVFEAWMLSLLYPVITSPKGKEMEVPLLSTPNNLVKYL